MSQASPCGCTAWFVSDLAGNLEFEGRFSHEEAHTMKFFYLRPFPYYFSGTATIQPGCCVIQGILICWEVWVTE